MQYNIPSGLTAKYTNLTDKIYTVTAIFGSGEYNSNVENTTTFTVERSPITFDNKNVTLNTTSNELHIQADIKDYHSNYLIGTNRLSIKINGITYKINNKQVLYNVQNGKVDIHLIAPHNVKNIRNIELVTGERVKYEGGRTTITDITKVE